MTPLSAQIACVKREISMRERVYPRWVENGKMTADKADLELEHMRAVLDTLKVLDSQNELFPKEAS